MKRQLFLLALFFVLAPGYGQFQATMKNAYSGEEKIYKVLSDGENYRYEFTENGQTGILIFRPAENKTFLLMPEKKTFLTRACDDMYTLMNDPVQGSLHFADPKDVSEKITGHEKLSGYDCVKKAYYMTYDNGEKVLTNVVWFSEDLNFPLKITFGPEQKVRMVLSDIKKWNPVKGYFKIPGGYTEVDDRGRPVIPEPPAPTHWTTRTVQLPFQGAVSRGTVLKFTIGKEGHYKMIAENKTDKPAKIIRSSLRDGKELPENIQGPEKYRTLRLYPGEKIPDTFIWKAGQEIIIRVFEGTMLLHIYFEK